MSKFKAIMDAKRSPADDSEAPVELESPRAAVSRPEPSQKRGRPPGKRSDPDYEQTTVYIKKQTALDVKRALIGGKQDFSELVETLLDEWLKR